MIPSDSPITHFRSLKAVKRKKHHLLVSLLTSSLVLSGLTPVIASESTPQQEPPLDATEQEISDFMEENDLEHFSRDYEIEMPKYSDDTIIIIDDSDDDSIEFLPPVITDIFEPEEEESFSTLAIGRGSVSGKVVVTRSASNGLYEKANVSGNYKSIASVALGFVKGITATTVGTVLSVVGITASATTTVRAKTFVSYRYTYRDGKGRWSSDPNKAGYWHLGYRTGQLETFKHIWGAKQNKTTKKWTTKSYDYKNASKVERSPNYKKSDAWLIKKAVSNVTAKTSYNETS